MYSASEKTWTVVLFTLLLAPCAANAKYDSATCGGFGDDMLDDNFHRCCVSNFSDTHGTLYWEKYTDLRNNNTGEPECSGKSYASNACDENTQEGIWHYPPTSKNMKEFCGNQKPVFR